jgi:hypothetical protein
MVLGGTVSVLLPDYDKVCEHELFHFASPEHRIIV